MAIEYEKGTIHLDAEEYWAIKAEPGGYDTSDATATADDILSGKTAYVASGKVTGMYTPGVLVEKTITANGEYLPASDNADGYSKVTVNVQPTGGSKLEQIISRTVTELTANDYDGATIIGQSAFSNCKQLRTVIIPNSVKTIGNSAFYNCTRLTEVTISDSIEKIEAYSFNSCSVLASITIYATIPPVLSDASSIPSNSIIYVPAASVEAYKTATNWANHASRIQAIPA